MTSSSTTENWIDLLYSWDEGDLDLDTDNQYTEYGLRYQLATFDKTFSELDDFISDLSMPQGEVMQQIQSDRRSGFERFDSQTIVVLFGLGLNTIFLSLMLVGLSIKMRYFRECWRNWPRLWIVTAITCTHILLLLWVQLRKSSMYQTWSTNGMFPCLMLSSLETILSFVGILYVVLLGAHSCCQVFISRVLIGPRQFVTWVSMTIFIWMIAIPVAVFVRRPYTGVYDSLFNKHCIMDTDAGFISLIVYTYAIPFCVLLGMICSCVIGICQTPKDTKTVPNTTSVISADVMILRWIQISRSWAVIFIAVLTALSFIARVPLFVVRVYQPYTNNAEYVHIAQTIYFGHFALVPFCTFLLKDMRDLFSSICMCCRCRCRRAEGSNVEPLSIRVQ